MVAELKFDTNRTRVAFCPCGKDNDDGKFAPFVGFDDCGYCHGCGENFFPKRDRAQDRHYEPSAPVEAQYLSHEILEASRAADNIEYNGLAVFLGGLAEQGYFTHEELWTAWDAYKIGTTIGGHTVFPMLGIDYEETLHVRTGQMIRYDKQTGKRNKKDIPPVDWLHRSFKIPNEATRKCFFGEHLLAGNDKPIGIVEAPKTALICAIYKPNAFVWLATCGKSGTKTASKEVCAPLVGRSVTLFPDLNAYPEWEQRAEQLRKNGVSDVTVSDWLKHKTTKAEHAQGLDLADYFLQFPKSKLLK